MAMSNSNEDEMIEKANKGSKWVKTDSECKVLIIVSFGFKKSLSILTH